MKEMKLDLEIVKIKDVEFGDETAINSGVLTINKKEMIEAVADPNMIDVDIQIAKPGESTRIVPVKDVIEPRVKVESGGYFPGILDNFEHCGHGTTRALKGCCVTTCGKIMGFQEGIIDMSGPAAKYNTYSQLINIVLVADPSEGLSPKEHETAIRNMGFKAALYVAKASLKVQPDEVETFIKQQVPSEKKLPRVSIAYLLMAQGLLHDSEIYGIDAKNLTSLFVHPNEVFDGAVVSGNCVTASDKSTTYDAQNNPLIKELYKRQGVDLEIGGIILNPISTLLAEKERNANITVNLARQLQTDVMIIPQEGGGNPEADLMLICEAAEKQGIRTVIMLHDHPGVDGTAEPMINTSPYADAIVTVGNDSAQIIIPEMERYIGHKEQLGILSGTPADYKQDDGTYKVGVSIIMGSTNNLGMNANSTEEI